MNVVNIDAKKNAAFELTVAMESALVEGEFLTGETVADTAYYKDGAGAWASLAITDTFSEIGAIGVYEISLTAGEMNHDWVIVKCTSDNARDALISIRTTDVDIDDIPTAAEIQAEMEENGSSILDTLRDTLGAVNDAAAAGDPTDADTGMAYLKQLINILEGTDGISSFDAEQPPGNGVNLSEVIRAIHADVTGLNGDAMRGTDSAALATVCTEARLAELDAANLPTDIAGVQTTADAVEADTQDIQGRIPAALTAGGNIKADSLAISGSTDAADKLEAAAETMLTGTVSNAVAAPTSTVFYASDITEATADHMNGRIVVFLDGDLLRQATDITDYELDTGEGKFTVTQMTEAPANGDTFIVI